MNSLGVWTEQNEKALRALKQKQKEAQVVSAFFADAKVGILAGETRYMSNKVKGNNSTYVYLGEGRFGEIRYDQIRGVKVYHPDIRKLENAKIVDLLNSLSNSRRIKVNP